MEKDWLVTGSIVARGGAVVVAPGDEFRGPPEQESLRTGRNQGRVRVAPDTATGILTID